MRGTALTSPHAIAMSLELSRPLAGLIDLVLPHKCAGCGAGGTSLCGDCVKEFGKLRRVRRRLLDECSHPAVLSPPVYALGRYRGAARRAVLAYKERGRRELAEPFGRGIASAIPPVAFECEAGTGRFDVVPAPSRLAESRRRGGSHMARVARHAASAAGEFGCTLRVRDCLTLQRGVRDSVGLEPADRLRNLSGRVHFRRKVTMHDPNPVVLIDDVLTSGATVLTCLHALHDAGFRVLAVVVLTAAGHAGLP